jgi:hypothetical protein
MALQHATGVKEPRFVALKPLPIPLARVLLLDTVLRGSSVVIWQDEEGPMFMFSNQFSTQSGARADAAQSDGAAESLGKKVRFDFERFSSLPREMFAFFSKATD